MNGCRRPDYRIGNTTGIRRPEHELVLMLVIGRMMDVLPGEQPDLELVAMTAGMGIVA